MGSKQGTALVLACIGFLVFLLIVADSSIFSNVFNMAIVVGVPGFVLYLLLMLQYRKDKRQGSEVVQLSGASSPALAP
jgi:hypothetical protein